MTLTAASTASPRGSIPDRGGLYLDLDGTLADSLHVMGDVYRRFLEGHGCAGSQEEFEQLNGPPLQQIVLLLKERHNLPASAAALTLQYSALVASVYQGVLVKPGAAMLMAAARSRGLPVAVVTSNSSAVARPWLIENGLQEYVDVLISCEDVSRGKPHPEPYWKALHDTQCAPELSVAVEDSLQGLQSAIQAGIGTCFFCGLETENLPKQVKVASDLQTIARHLTHGEL